MFKGIELEDFKKVISIIEELDDVKLISNIASFKNNIFISSENGETELYIKKSLNSIIISRVKFNKKRAGIMTKVLEELINITKLYEYDTIIVESVLTTEMANFCNKNGFEKVNDCFCISPDDYMGNYKLSLSRNTSI